MPRSPQPPDPFLVAEIIRLRSLSVPWKIISQDYLVSKTTCWRWIHYGEQKMLLKRLRDLKTDPDNSEISGNAAQAIPAERCERSIASETGNTLRSGLRR
jgi:hypothetical protein